MLLFHSPLGGQEIRFGFEKKQPLRKYFFETDSPTEDTKTILICSGSHCSYEHYAIPMVEALKSMGHNAMVFNYEGFGNSEGIPSETPLSNFRWKLMLEKYKPEIFRRNKTRFPWQR